MTASLYKRQFPDSSHRRAGMAILRTLANLYTTIRTRPSKLIVGQALEGDSHKAKLIQTPATERAPLNGALRR